MAEQGNGAECTGAEVARLLVAGLVGAVIGASLGLLLAPKAGSELRHDLREKAGTAAEKAHVVQEKARDLVEAAKHKIEERRAAHAPEATPPQPDEKA
ncbi:MAG: YtxH domain-containing protein [Armatimonadetes bacterium]|nr:YtxH domain-containing protein [Armatimonadota bacterium]